MEIEQVIMRRRYREMNDRPESMKFRYNDRTERYRRMNTFFVGAVTGLWALFIIYLLLKLGASSIAVPTVIGNVVLVVIFTVVNLVIYLRNKADEKLKHLVSIGMAVEFLLLGVQTDAEFIYFALIGVLALQIPHYLCSGFYVGIYRAYPQRNRN